MFTPDPTYNVFRGMLNLAQNVAHNVDEQTATLVWNVCTAVSADMHIWRIGSTRHVWQHRREKTTDI